MKRRSYSTMVEIFGVFPLCLSVERWEREVHGTDDDLDES
jgi:hypothetical protein